MTITKQKKQVKIKSTDPLTHQNVLKMLVEEEQCWLSQNLRL